MRGLLVVNPRATTTSSRVVDVLVHAFAADIDLEVTFTTHRGHGRALGERARSAEMDVVVTLGGDGVINEVANGMLVDGPGPDVPMLAPVPGGSANVVARSLGIPNDAVEATGLLLEQLRDGVHRHIGLGHAHWDATGDQSGDQWFLANAGVGIDAEIIAAMERHRAAGHSATPLRYLSTTLAAFFRHTDRKEPTLTIRDDSSLGAGPTNWPSTPDPVRVVDGAFFAFVQNTSPWTFLGTLPINPCPDASFDTGLDLFTLRRMRVPTALVAATRMVRGKGHRDARGGLVSWHDRSDLTITAVRPVAFQIDGEGVGPASELRLTSHPAALRVVC